MKKFFLLSLFLLLLLLCPYARAKEISKWYVADIRSRIINQTVKEYISSVIEGSNEDASVSGTIILIDTPGGFLAATQGIVKDILNSKKPVLGYIYPRGADAGSAGMYIMEACDVVAMAPSTRIGAAHPVFMLGGLSGGKAGKDIGVNEVKKPASIMEEKVLNDTLAFFRSYVKEKRKDVDMSLAEALVTKSKSLTEEQALKAHIIDVICGDMECVVKYAREKGIVGYSKRIEFETISFKPLQELMYYISHPFLLYILSSVSVLLLIFEFTHPGFGAPGIVGLLGLGISMYGYGILPTNYFGLVLLGLGILFIVIELFTPAFGLLAISGAGAIVWGSLLLWNTSDSLYSMPIGAVISAITVIFLFVFGLLASAVKLRLSRPVTGKDAMEGGIAEVVEDVNEKGGKVFYRGEYWNAISREKIKKGEKAKIEKVNGLLLVVKPEKGG